MKTNRLILYFLLAGAVSVPSCEPDKKMMVETGDVSNIMITTADVSGIVIDVGEGATQHGHCYGTTAGPLITGTKTSMGVAATGDFTSNLTGLAPSTKYFARAYCSLGGEAAYGSEITFTTASAALAELTTTAITGITKNTAVSGGSITSEGGTPVTARGACWSTAANPAVDNDKTTNGSGTGSFTSNITGLSSGTIYYVRAYATNGGGTAYGNELTFTTSPEVVAVPTVTTALITSITTNSAVSGGEVTGDGGSAITAKGVCWSTSANPTITNSKTNDGTGSGSYVSNLTNLIAGTTYYVRAYATNSAGTSYGDEHSFTTNAVVPAVTTVPATSITTTSASSGGDVTNNGGSSVIARGVCWSTSQNPTIDGGHSSDGPGMGTFTSSITGLTGNTTYYLRAYATNGTGTGYGNELSFKTSPVIPIVATAEISGISSTTAISGGNIVSDGGTAVTAKGVCWSTTSDPTTADSKTSDGTGTDSFVCTITGLIPGTTYHVRAYALNSIGTAYGADVTFTAGAVMPVITTTTVTDITATAATSGGNITSDGGSSVTARGVCWSTSENPTTADSKTSDGTGTGSFISSITGLTSGTIYHVRAYATSSAGTAYAQDITFTAGSVPPVVTTTAISEITSTTASSGGNVTSDGGASVTARGVCWSTSASPTTADSKTSDANGTGSYSSSITGLTPCTLYHVRAYATNTAGTSYGDDVSLTTGTAPATVMTTAISAITATTASSGGSITGSCASTVTERGVCWSTNADPTTADSKTSDGTGGGSYTSSITGLTNGTLYHVRAYAINTAGTAYGEDISFTAGAIAPTVTTTAISDITAATASSGGEVTSDGGSSVTARGVCWSASANPTTADSKTSDGSGTGTFVSGITGLIQNTTYHVRAYATNGVGTAYGSDIEFTTSSGVVAPTLTTASIAAIATTSVRSGGTLVSDGGEAVTLWGVCWNTSVNPIIANNKTEDGSGTNSFTSVVTGLTGNTTYYLRSYATNSAGTGYGNELSFTTTSSVTDYDGNIYSTVQIGSQLWMQENLKVTHYRNGNAISNVTDNTEWSNLTSGAYCWYNNDEATYKAIYGALYNYHTTVDNRNLCPTGWHVPTDDEWTTLMNSLGGQSVAGGKMKEPGTTHWISPNTGATNESGLTALPGGYRDNDGLFTYVGYGGDWWSSTNGSSTIAYNRFILYSSSDVSRNYNNTRNGFSIRCLHGEGQVLPAITTTAISNITTTTASSGGNITSDGGASVTSRGVCWSTSANPYTSDSKTTDGNGTGSFVSSITGLIPNTTYHVRAYATNSVGTVYGSDVEFTTSSSGVVAPTLTTTSITAVATTSVRSGGTLVNNGGEAITVWGVCWNTSVNPTIANNKTEDGSGTNSFTSIVTGLTGNTTYYLRSYATNSAGTGYGDELSFTTTSSVTDYDGNIYNIVQIGTQLWMQENLKVIHYRNGDAVANVTDNAEWSNLTSGAYCWYNNDEATYKTIYGALYNFHTTIDNRNLCPTGWHVPTDAEWTTMEDYLIANGYNYDGTTSGNKIAKSLANAVNWIASSTEGAIGNTDYLTKQNATGFAAHPGGYRYDNGTFNLINGSGYLWSATELDATSAWQRSLYYDYSYQRRDINSKNFGFSVRCMQGEGQLLPAITTTAISNVSTTIASSGGNITSDGGASVTARGACWSTNPAPIVTDNHTSDGSGTGIFTSSITGLTANTTYYVRAYATNSIGTAYGDQVSFTTSSASLATLTTTTISALASLTANSGGDITSDGGASVTERGVCWNTSANPTTVNSKTNDGTGTGSFISSLTGLTPNTTYYLRAYATNSAGTSYGNETSFTTTVTITDYDENIYNTVQVGTQLWMQENLKVTHYRNGDVIAYVTDNTAWSNLTSGAYCWYNNDEATYKANYGALYNYYTTVDNRNLCPTGWHVPTNAEWTTLADYLGGLTVAGGKLKEAGTSHWTTPNEGATNESGFTALPGGARYGNGNWLMIGYNGCWWSSMENDLANAWYRQMLYNLTNVVGAYEDKKFGLSVRCILGEGQVSPAVTTAAISDITTASASCGGNVTSDGGASVTARGVCWSTSPGPTTANNKTTDGSGTGSFASSLSGLNPGTLYYVRAYATNSVGTVYGNEQSFTTGTTIPSLTTNVITSITTTTASSGGNITSDGGVPVTARGVCWSTSTEPTTDNIKTTNGSGTGSFTSSLTGLAPGMTYYVRAYATNSVGTAYGNERSFTTGTELPALTTSSITSITPATATGGGSITSDGGTSVTARGVCWNTSANPTTANSKTTDGSGTGSFTSNLTGLTANTFYYLRAYATNSVGTAYGNEITFTSTPIITDYDGNSYNTVQIGTQVWVQENLKVTHYRNGDAITYVTDNAAWRDIYAPAYCWYNNDEGTYKAAYGALYNHYTTIDNRNLCPAGWHVPTDDEWAVLTDYLGGLSVAGGKLKESGIAHWTTPNEGATNESFFTALPGGIRAYNGPFSGIGTFSYWWSSTEYLTTYGWYRSLSHLNDDATRNTSGETQGYSVRCIQGEGQVLPAVTTSAISNITTISATSGGNITSDGGASVTARGVCWNTSSKPTTANNKTTDGTGVDSFVSSLSGLNPGTTYYVRAYATNSVGTVYGNEQNFTTSVTVPTLTTTTISLVTSTTATSGGDITSNGGASVTARGVCWSTSTNPTTADSKTDDGSGNGSFVSTMSGLIPGTTYYIRAYATNSAGTAYGNQLSFKTLNVPSLATTSISLITETSAQSGGNITDFGGASVTARGVCWNTSPNPTTDNSKTFDGSGIGSYTSSITDLSPGTIYYVRAYATNSVGTGYGNELSYKTKFNYTGQTGTLTDSRDGHEYDWVGIGYQVWMAENMAYLPAVSPPANESNTEPYYYVYGYEGTDVNEAKLTANYAIYGVYYNWPAAMNGEESSNSNPSGVQGICPTSWHLPSDSEWTELTDYLGGESVAGSKVKETGTLHWVCDNTDATNESGFTALGCGCRSGSGSFISLNLNTHFWSATQNSTLAWTRYIYCYNTEFTQSISSKGYGYSIRCVRD